jgi:hypothetical protein
MENERKRLIDFLQNLKEEINIGRSRNDLKTLINKEIKSINRGSDETQAVRLNEQTKEVCLCGFNDMGHWCAYPGNRETCLHLKTN